MRAFARDLVYFKRWRLGGWILVAMSLAVSLTPSLPTFTVQYSDKVFHALTYFILMFWFAGIYRDRIFWLLALAFALMGVAVEFIQTTVPYRFFDRYDLLANVVGILIAWFLASLGMKNWCEGLEARLTGNGGE